MRVTPNQKQQNQRMIISQGIKWWMRERGLTLPELARHTGRTKEYIRKVIDGEPVEIALEFLQSCVMAFGRMSARFYEDTPEILTLDQCVGLIKPLPPRQGKLW